MRIAITGANGLLGPFLIDEFGPGCEVIALSRSDADLAVLDQVEDLMRLTRPDVVVHAAAYTDVDGCERDKERARRDNTLSTENVARSLDPRALLVFLSTDQVYPDVSGPHSEDRIGPVNVYGTSKLEAEVAVLERERGLVSRCNFFAASRTPSRSSLSDVIVRSLAAGQRFTGFIDSYFSPLHATTLARELRASVEQGLTGVYNFGSTSGCSKADFARLIARHLAFDESLIDDVESTTLAGRAPRPHDLRMNTSRYAAETGRQLPTLEHEVALL